MIKALTLHEPYASMMADGLKKFETRSWGTNYRGFLAIHAAKKTPVDLNHFRMMHKDFLAKNEATSILQNLTRGKVVCIVLLMDCVATEMMRCQVNYDEMRFGDYSDNRYVWKTKFITRLDHPIPARGFQGIWNWDAPEGLGELLSRASTSTIIDPAVIMSLPDYKRELGALQKTYWMGIEHAEEAVDG